MIPSNPSFPIDPNNPIQPVTPVGPIGPIVPSGPNEQEMLFLWVMLQTFMDNLEKILIPPQAPFMQGEVFVFSRASPKELQSFHQHLSNFRDELHQALALYAKDPVLKNAVEKLLQPMASLLMHLHKMMEEQAKGGRASEELIKNFEETFHFFLSNMGSILQQFPHLFTGNFKEVLQKYLQSPLFQKMMALQPGLQTLLPQNESSPSAREEGSNEPSTGAKTGASLEERVKASLQGAVQVRIGAKESIPFQEPVWQNYAQTSHTMLFSSLQLPSIHGEHLPVYPPSLREQPLALLSSPQALQVLPQQTEQNPTSLPLAFVVPYPFLFPPRTNASASEIQTEEEGEKGKKKESGGGAEKPNLLFTFIPKGDALYGDPFQEGALDEQPLREIPLHAFGISVYLITASQYATWLSDQWELHQIVLGEHGKVYDLENRLLCQTVAGISTSDIEVHAEGAQIFFKPVRGKEQYPVVHVSYAGAERFAKSNGFRLPTEVEWEKAAAMALQAPSENLKKYRYGCGRDFLNPSLANYLENPVGVEAKLNAPTPVGFFNGMTSYVKGNVTIQTEDAASPYGCYDMSGNVREWTDKGDELRKIVKGGSYSHTLHDLRASARQWMERSHMDAYTGFRVVLDVPSDIS